MGVVVVPIPESSRALLACASGWQETKVPAGARIAKHFHDFQAYYYTFGIAKMQTDEGELSLPQAAMIVVPQGVVHGWVGPHDGGGAAVGHFHEGHGYHFVENVDGGRVLHG